jgi:ADP-ribose pyrophosphatase YjhB (NUDIX family)
MQYEGPKVAAEIVLLKEGQVLVAKRGIEPRKGKYDMPGGFIETTENAEQAAYRELKEELGLEKSDVGELKYLRTFNGDYPYGPEVYRVLVVVFVAHLKPGASVNAADDIASCEWVSSDEIDSVDWALDEHRINAVQTFKQLT